LLKKQKITMAVAGGLAITTGFVVMLVMSWDTFQGFGQVLSPAKIANPPELVRVKRQIAGVRDPDCALPAFSGEVEVIAASAYSGRVLDRQIDQSGNPAGQVDVFVDSDKPTVLLLSAYDPTIWNLHWSANTTLVGVYATGHHRQVVAGAPQGLPVILAGHDAAKEGNCPGRHLKTHELDAFSLQAIGHPVEELYALEGDALDLEIVRAAAPVKEFLTSNATPPSAFYLKDDMLAGQLGLAVAVKAGKLRPLTDADREQTMARLSAAFDKDEQMQYRATVSNGMTKEQWLEYIIPPSHSDNAYVVTGPFEYPAGLFGGHLAHFIIPDDVPKPTGDPGHSQVIDLSTGTCTGGPC